MGDGIPPGMDGNENMKVGTVVGRGIPVGAGDVAGIPLIPHSQDIEISGAALHTPGLIFPARPFISNMPHVTP
jgi:hypothetical protein